MAYFPNGTAGGVLDAQCAVCPVGSDPDAPCPVLLIQVVYNYEQHDKGNEKLKEAMGLLIDEKGICQMKKTMEEAEPPDPKKPPLREVEFVTQGGEVRRGTIG